MNAIYLALGKAKACLKKALTKWEIRRCEAVMLSHRSSLTAVHNAAVRLCKLKEIGVFCVPVNSKQ